MNDHDKFIFIHISLFLFFTAIFHMFTHIKGSLFTLRINYPQEINKRKISMIRNCRQFINNR